MTMPRPAALLQTLSFLFAYQLQAQSPCDLVHDLPVFECVDTSKSVPYGQGRRDYLFPDPLNGCAPFEALYTDVFRPCEAGSEPRPLVIFIHGGAFAAGNKADFWPQCHDFARRGYVTATIQYRLSINLLSLNRRDFIRAGYRAQQDAKAAVRFFKANAAQFNIDTSNIFLLGYSAGAVTALSVVYARDADERPAEANLDLSCGYWFGCPFCPDLGNLEGEGGNPAYSSRVKGIYAMAGALPELSLIDGHDMEPVAMIHGTEDQTVDYDSSCFLNLVPCPRLYGSNSILQKSESLQLCTRLTTLEGAGHDLSAHAGQITEEAAAFFQELVCQGNPCAVNSLEEPRTARLQVFPVPARELLHLSLPPDAMGEWRITGLGGQVLKAGRLEPGTADRLLSISDLPAGFYFLSWLPAKGSAEVVRFVK